MRVKKHFFCFLGSKIRNSTSAMPKSTSALWDNHQNCSRSTKTSILWIMVFDRFRRHGASNFVSWGLFIVFCTVILPRKCCGHLGSPWSRLKVIIWAQIDHSVFSGIGSGTLGQALFSSIFALWALIFAWFTGSYRAYVFETVQKLRNKPKKALGCAIEL